MEAAADVPAIWAVAMAGRGPVDFRFQDWVGAGWAASISPESVPAVAVDAAVVRGVEAFLKSN